jgi:SAM-dependent methyltransferase
VYGEDLAYIHDVGFAEAAADNAAPILRWLPRGARVFDLGCGTGVWARRLTDAGHSALGSDPSRAMIALARRHAPRARFQVGTAVRGSDLDAVTALGEIVNYQPAEPLSRRLAQLHAALRPGGLFVFDAAGPGRVPGGGPSKSWSAGADWAVLVERSERRMRLLRTIVCFRRVGRSWRRSEERHELRLYRPAEVEAALARAGFRVRTVAGFARPLPPGLTGFVARRT